MNGNPDRRFRGLVRYVGGGWFVWAVVDLKHHRQPVAWGEEGNFELALREAHKAVGAYRQYYYYKRQGVTA